MKKDNIFDLQEFVEIIKRYLNRGTPYGSIGKMFDILFEWIYQEEYGFTGEHAAVLAKWLNGSRPLPKKVTNAILDNFDNSIERFQDCCFHLYQKDAFITDENMYHELLEQMEKDRFLVKNGIHYGRNYATHPKREIFAGAFFNAVVNNYIKWNVKIDVEVQNALEKELNKCQNMNQPFQTPHVLHALLNMENSLLYKTLEKIHPKFGDSCIKNMKIYVSQTHHGNYQEIRLEEMEFLFYAKKASIWHKPPVIAGQKLIIEWLFESDTKTIRNINDKILAYSGNLNDTLEKISDKDESSSIDIT